MIDETKTEPKKAAVKKFVAKRRFEGAEVGDVVALTSATAKHLNKHGAIAPYIEDDDEDS